MDNRDNRNSTILLISVAVCLFLYLSTHLLSSKEAKPQENNQTEVVNETVEYEPVKKKVVVIIKQPSTHISYMYTNVLQEILLEYHVKRELCTPDDFHNEEKHKMPKAASKTIKATEPPVIVVYVAVGLLLTSLGAAVLDFFKAKSDMKTPEDGKKKPSLTRTCSLADLTVLRHSRKESMRKESIYEGSQAKVTGRKVSRPPLRLD